jgi:hypothetical protein
MELSLPMFWSIGRPFHWTIFHLLWRRNEIDLDFYFFWSTFRSKISN